MPSDVVIYGTPYCGFCLRAKWLLEKKGIAFREVNVSGDSAARRRLLETTASRQVPQIFIDGRHVGGFDDLAALDRSGELDELVGRGAPSMPS